LGFKNERFAKKKPEFENLIGDVRGTGFFLGLEFVKTKDGREPNEDLGRYAVETFKKKFRILTGLDGRHYNTIKIKPPMCFTKENVDYFVSSLEWILTAFKLL